MSQADTEPEVVYVWICAVHDTERELCARATRDRAEQWVEERLGSSGDWCEGPGAKDMYQTGDCEGNGMVALAPLPDCVGMLVSEA